MKSFWIKILIFASLLNVAGMCSKDDDNLKASVDPTPVINTVKSGTWRITLFEDSGINVTSNFLDYNFTFGNSSILTASNGINTYSGLWSVTSNENGDDNPNNDLDFNITFSSPSNFVELSEDWDIIERTDTKVRLKHVSGGDASTEYLTFEKN